MFAPKLVADAAAQQEVARVLLAPLLLLSAQFRPVEEAPRVAHHQRRYALGMSHGEADRGAPAHRLRHQRGALHLQPLEQRFEVVDEARGILVRRVGGAAEAAVIDGDAAVALAEVGHLLPPRDVVAACTVQEHDRRTFPVRLVVQLDPVELLDWHG